jgi:hypothetical protein
VKEALLGRDLAIDTNPEIDVTLQFDRARDFSRGGSHDGNHPCRNRLSAADDRGRSECSDEKKRRQPQRVTRTWNRRN